MQNKRKLLNQAQKIVFRVYNSPEQDGNGQYPTAATVRQPYRPCFGVVGLSYHGSRNVSFLYNN